MPSASAASVKRPILLVDDEAPSRNATQMALEHLGYSVETAESAEEALAAYSPKRHLMVLTDNRMPGKSGNELARELRRQFPKVKILLYTGFAPPRCDAVDLVLEKPVQLADLESAVQTLLRKK